MTLATPALHALDFEPKVMNGYLSAGESGINLRGHSVFRTVQFEVAGESKLVESLLPRTEVFAAIAYSRVRQAHSWFGYRDGEGDDNIRAEVATVGLRHRWAQSRPIGWYFEIGTGPMWSNRRIPAATSRLNFNSQSGVGVTFFQGRTSPIHFGYRFMHISNGGMASRNPGLNVHTLVVGTGRALRR